MSQLSRRWFLSGAAAAIACPPLARAAGNVVVNAPVTENPLVRQRADAQVFRHVDGNYYLTASVPEYDRLIVRRSPTLASLGTAEKS